VDFGLSKIVTQDPAPHRPAGQSPGGYPAIPDKTPTCTPRMSACASTSSSAPAEEDMAGNSLGGETGGGLERTQNQNQTQGRRGRNTRGASMAAAATAAAAPGPGAGGAAEALESGTCAAGPADAVPRGKTPNGSWFIKASSLRSGTGKRPAETSVSAPGGQKKAKQAPASSSCPKDTSECLPLPPTTVPAPAPTLTLVPVPTTALPTTTPSLPRASTLLSSKMRSRGWGRGQGRGTRRYSDAARRPWRQSPGV
jgi:hypothetical protein